jgi:hypothetical protein
VNQTIDELKAEATQGQNMREKDKAYEGRTQGKLGTVAGTDGVAKSQKF